MRIKVGGKSIVSQVAVARGLPVSAILGRGLPEMLQLLRREADVVLATPTRAQTRVEFQERARMEDQDRCSGAEPNPVDEDE